MHNIGECIGKMYTSQNKHIKHPTLNSSTLLNMVRADVCRLVVHRKEQKSTDSML